jgi:hypothetical protein
VSGLDLLCRTAFANIQYAVRRLGKKNRHIVLALLGTGSEAPSANSGPDVAEGPFSIALEAIGEAVSTISQTTLESKGQNLVGMPRP